MDVDTDDFFGTVVKRYGQLRRGAAVDKPIVFPHLVRAHYDPTDNHICKYKYEIQIVTYVTHKNYL